MKKNKKIRKKKELKIKSKEIRFSELLIKDLKILGFILFITIVVFLFNLVNSVILVYPKDNGVTYDRSPEFRWNGRYNYYRFYLGSDKDFNNLIVSDEVYTSSYKIKDKLSFGNYYWKVVAVNNDREISSAIYRLRIESLVATEINETLKNVGNTVLDVEALDNTGKITGSAILDIDQEMKANNDTLYKVEQYE